MNKIVVISGGGTGIGLATAKLFAVQGASVLIIGRRESVLEDATDKIATHSLCVRKPAYLVADLSMPNAVEEVCHRIASDYMQVDVLVNAAGGNVLMQAADAAYTDGLSGLARRWIDNFNNNVLSAVLLTEGLRPHLRSPGARIVFISSIAAYRGSGMGCYGAAKAALHPYAYDMAAAMGPKGITVNVVAPGYVEQTEFFGKKMTSSRREMLITQTMTGRAGQPEDVASCIAWLASDAAGHVTAQIVQINGGAQRGR